MSADSETANETERVSVRLTDPAVAAAFGAAAEEVGSKSEAVREAVRKTYLDGRDVAADVPDAFGDVPKKARQGHRKLVQYTGVNGHIEVEAAESILANHLNINTDSVRQVVTRPLVNAGLFDVQTGVHQVAIVVRDVEHQVEGGSIEDVETEEDAEPVTTAEAEAELNALAAAGEEVADE